MARSLASVVGPHATGETYMTRVVVKRTAAILIAITAPTVFAQASIDQLKQRCAEYGFAPGSSELAGCVQKLDMQMHQQACERIAQQARFFCNGGGSDTISPAFSAGKCGEAQDAFQANCQ